MVDGDLVGFLRRHAHPPQHVGVYGYTVRVEIYGRYRKQDRFFLDSRKNILRLEDIPNRMDLGLDQIGTQ